MTGHRVAPVSVLSPSLGLTEARPVCERGQHSAPLPEQEGPINITLQLLFKKKCLMSEANWINEMEALVSGS